MEVFRAQLPNTRPMGNEPRDRTIWEPAQLMLRRIFEYADPVDEAVVDGRQIQLSGPRGDLEVQWALDGAPIATTTVDEAFTAPASGGTLTAIITVEDDTVRQHAGELEQVFTWMY